MTRGALVALVAGALTASTFAARAYASPTDADPGFNGGAVVLGSMAHDEGFADLTVLGNGKTMVLVSTGADPALALYRLNSNGTPDTTFGSGGRFAFAPADSYEDVHLAVDPSTGKSYVSTFLDNGSTSPTTVWRIRANGSLDSTYGPSGGHRVFTKRLVEGLLPLSHGMLLMAGQDFTAHSANVWRLTDSGATDPQYGTGGKAVLSTDVNDEVSGLARQLDGKVVVAGDHYSPTASTLQAYRLTSGGVLDTAFSGDGKAAIDPSSVTTTTSTVWTPQVLLRPDGRMVFVAGLNQNNGSFFNSLLVAGLTKGGNPDAVFGKHTYTGVTETWGDAALERDGKIVVTGVKPPSPSSANLVLRFTARGALDPTWSGDGTYPLSGASDTIGVGITPHGRVIVGRTIHRTTYDVALKALRGTLTPSCDHKLATQFGGSGADRIIGTPRADVLVGAGGADVLKGNSGRDTLCGNAGNDKLYGGPGKDVLIGGPGDDLIRQ